jgi:uncharacterized caspase-like protein
MVHILSRCLGILALAVLAKLGSSVQYPQLQPERLIPGQRWAIVIGVDHYPHLGSLRFAGKDATDLAGVLTSTYGVSTSNIRLLTDKSSKKPSAQNILHELDDLLTNPKLASSDLFIFYFGGHGI